jgi:hypothetical protein
MEEHMLPIVPGTGKYAGKCVTELMADKSYVDNFLKNQLWFNADNKNWAPIYNILINQSISTNKDAKTPEHNKLQNMFLVKENQQKLLSIFFKKKFDLNEINMLFADENIIRCFGDVNIPKFTNNLDNTRVVFEDKYNWDAVLYYRDNQKFQVESNLEIELADKEKYKQVYDKEQKKIYENHILLIDKLIEYRIKLDAEKMHDYEENLKNYSEEETNYVKDLENYLKKKSQNDKDITKYENDLKLYENKKTKFITQKKKIICDELGINYDDFINWNTTGGYSYSDNDTKHTLEEKILFKNIINDKLKLFITQFEIDNKKPNFVEKLKIPTKPSLPKKPNLNESINIYKSNDMYNLFNELTKIMPMIELYNVNNLESIKTDYINKYVSSYEKIFTKHYEEYRMKYYRDIINKYSKTKTVGLFHHNNQYTINIEVCDYYDEIYCELKPTLGDDYPCVLRKLNTQIKLTHNDNTKKTEKGHRQVNGKYTLIVGNFNSTIASKEDLIKIFKQSNIYVIFADNLFGTTNYKTLNSREFLFENKTEYNSILEIQQNFLQLEEKYKQLEEKNKQFEEKNKQLEEKNKQLEEKNKQLEEEIQLLKTQKQKTIKDYFKNK